MATFYSSYFSADWDLEIDPVSVDDDDVYQCQVTLGYTSSLRSKKAKVEVLVPPQNPFIKEGAILNVKESRDVDLTCVAQGGKPAAKVCTRIINILCPPVKSAPLCSNYPILCRNTMVLFYAILGTSNRMTVS